MTYRVKNIFFSLQGEGVNAGRAAVFCRFSGCNLWSGRDEDRLTARCRFCDTDFLWTGEGGDLSFESAEDLVADILSRWPCGGIECTPLVVLTGGEPLLQLDSATVALLHQRGFEIALETNGSLPAPNGLDWISVSPKAGVPLAQRSGTELKLVFPQEQLNPEDYLALDFRWHCLQPMDGPSREENTMLAVEYCLAHPQWRLSLQLHKILGVP